ncbi:CU044_5270 family protein [Nocardioides campestrisoli]|uniref:CU044_5270 family protein n=1 Tax=Nocardioides campestrisoli TaxID=2736757 RepID=UPI0015E7A781|nr:CU044_5270 family protein [Nocardioides campestrisoli]
MHTTDRAHDQLVRELLELAPPPDPQPLDDQSRARLESELLSVIHQHVIHEPVIHEPAIHRPARARARDLLGRVGPAALVAACLAAVVGVGALALQPSTPAQGPTALPVRAEPDAVRALDGLTSIALGTATPTVAEDQFVYVRSTVISNEGTLGGAVTLGEPHEREIWLSQAGSTDELGLIREDGQDWPVTSGGYVAPAGPERPTYRWLSSLPADPDALIKEIASRQHLGSPVSSDQYAFERIGDMISEGLVPPDLSGHLFQALTKIPGVEHTPDVQDAVGRRGFGISRTDEFSGVTAMWVFRPSSPVPLGTRWYLSGRGGSPAVLFGATAVLERGVADAIGVRPGDRGPAAT